MFEIEPDEKVVASQNLEQICKNRIFDEDDFTLLLFQIFLVRTRSYEKFVA